MPKKKGHKKVRIQVDLDREIARALKMEAASKLQTLTKFITKWVMNWKDKKK